MTKKFFYILPSYNESLNLYELLSNFKNFYNNKKANVIIVIIDDGSNDNSLSIIKKFTKKNKTKKFSVKTLIHKKNLGLGRALKTGFEYCFLKGNNNDILITMDTDNSHTVSLSYKMAKQILLNKKDIVIASRYQLTSKTKGLNKLRKILSFGAAILYKIFFPIKNIKDYTSGFRAFRLGKIKNVWKIDKKFFSEKGFSASADILLKLYKDKNKIRFSELPINLRYDLKKGESKMKIFKTIYLNIALIIKRKIF
jgi:dolichol-phosphate mannosyltransferase